MRINAKKTKELNICFAKSPTILQPFTIDNVPFNQPHSQEYRSNLILNGICTLELFAGKQISVSGYALPCLKRSTSGVLPRDLCSVFCCFIRPVEYACPVWRSSLSNAMIDELEQIQKRATKIMLPGLSHSERLAHLKLPTLQERRDELCRRFYQTIMRPEDIITMFYLL